jgi:hypothetical protein
LARTTQRTIGVIHAFAMFAAMMLDEIPVGQQVS